REECQEGSSMNIAGTGRRVRIYTGEASQWRGKPLFLAVLEFLRAEGAVGATVTRGVAGFGANSRVHTATLFRLSADLPPVSDWVDTSERVARLLPHLHHMVISGLIIVEAVILSDSSYRPLRVGGLL